MRRPQARSPATAEAVREAHVAFQAGRLKRREATSPQTAMSMLAVYDGRTRIGQLLLRGKLGVEALDVNDRSLGLFPDTRPRPPLSPRGQRHDRPLTSGARAQAVAAGAAGARGMTERTINIGVCAMALDHWSDRHRPHFLGALILR